VTRLLTARGLALRGRLVLLFLLALLPAFIASLITTFEHRERLREGAADTTVRLARLTAARLEGSLRSTYRLLQLLDDDPLILAGGRSCESRFEHVLAVADHEFTAFALLDPAGRVTCSSPRAARGVAVGHPLLRRLDGGEDFVVGEAELGPITGKPVIVAVQAIRAGDQLTGMVAVGLDLRSLGDVAEHAQLPPGAILTILNRHGMIVARYPDPQRYIGRSVADQPGFREVMASHVSHGVLEAPNLEGVPHVWGYAPLEVGGARFFTMVGLDAGQLLAPAEHVLYDNLRGFALAAAVALVLAALAGEFFLRRPIEQMRRTAERIAGGDLTARVGLNQAPGELDALARAIDEMAEGLQSREHRLAGLSRRVLHVQELERRAIARELHDEIGQSLTAIKLMLQRHRKADGCRDTATIDELMTVADRTLQQVRGLSLDLRPSMLDHLGLAATLRWYVDREAERAGYVVTYHVDPEGLRLDAQHETALFRIAQEALTNVARHANATRVDVVLTSNGRETELSIRDDGRGFDIAAARERGRRGESLGLLGMDERAVLAGGTLKIQSGPSGTEVRAVVPGGSA